MLANAARLVEEAFEESPGAEGIAKWQKQSNITLPLFLRGLERNVRKAGLARLLMLWQELRIEILWVEIAAECDGDDLRSDYLKAEAASLRLRLLALIGAVSPKHARKPPEPSDEVLAEVRKHVEEAMRIMGFREPEE